MIKRWRSSQQKSEPSRIRQDFYLDAAQVAYLEEIAERTTLTKAEVIRFALDELIKRYPRKEPHISLVIALQTEKIL